MRVGALRTPTLPLGGAQGMLTWPNKMAKKKDVTSRRDGTHPNPNPNPPSRLLLTQVAQQHQPTTIHSLRRSCGNVHVSRRHRKDGRVTYVRPGGGGGVASAKPYYLTNNTTHATSRHAYVRHTCTAHAYALPWAATTKEITQAAITYLFC